MNKSLRESFHRLRNQEEQNASDVKPAKKQPTVREINAHVFAGTGSCYVDLPDGRRFRISRARTRKGVVEGRIVIGSEKDWEPIPADSEIEFSQ